MLQENSQFNVDIDLQGHVFAMFYTFFLKSMCTINTTLKSTNIHIYIHIYSLHTVVYQI